MHTPRHTVFLQSLLFAGGGKSLRNMMAWRVSTLSVFPGGLRRLVCDRRPPDRPIFFGYLSSFNSVQRADVLNEAYTVSHVVFYRSIYPQAAISIDEERR